MSNNESSFQPLPEISEDLRIVVLDPESREATLEGITQKVSHDRLRTLGHELVEVSVLHMLYEMYPTIAAPFLLDKRSTLLTVETIAVWSRMYRLTGVVDEAPRLMSNPANYEKVCAGVFEAYIAAITLEHKLDTACAAVIAIAKPFAENNINADTLGSVNASVSPISEDDALLPQQIQPHMAQDNLVPFFVDPMDPRSSPFVARHGNGNSSNTRGAGGPGQGFGALAAFRQKAAQLRKEVQFQEAFQGPDHMRTWTAKIMVDGVPKGEGSAATKQMAKDRAARMAMVALNWI